MDRSQTERKQWPGDFHQLAIFVIRYEGAGGGGGDGGDGGQLCTTIPALSPCTLRCIIVLLLRYRSSSSSSSSCYYDYHYRRHY